MTPAALATMLMLAQDADNKPTATVDTNAEGDVEAKVDGADNEGAGEGTTATVNTEPPPPPMPRLMSVVPPSIEESAWKSVQAQSVICEATIDVDARGRTRKVTLAAPDVCSGDFGKAMTLALRSWKYAPAIQDEKPVASTASVRIDFQR